MSRPRKDWWGYVKGMVRRYPERTNANEREAVVKALEQTKSMPDGEQRLAIIEMMYIEKTHTLAGAALRIPCSERTARRWHSQFIWAVANNFKCDKLA